LKGPIPWDWLCKAASETGRALHVAIALWFLAGVKKTGRVKLSGAILRSLGVTRHSAARGLKKLEAANLVKVERFPGRNPIVTLLPFPHGDEQSDA
jgi:DNA-binding MarR family transcriptional regulator